MLSSPAPDVTSLRFFSFTKKNQTYQFSGVPQALISVNAIDFLCDLYSSSNDTTIGIASVALGYLSNVPEAQRMLLKR